MKACSLVGSGPVHGSRGSELKSQRPISQHKQTASSLEMLRLSKLSDFLARTAKAADRRVNQPYPQNIWISEPDLTIGQGCPC